MTRRVAAALAALLLSGMAHMAGAADPPASGSTADAGAGVKVTAEDLYQQGLTLVEQGKWAEAAARFEESNRLERAPGTTLVLADCYEHMGRFASAWTLFVEAASIFNRRTPPDPRGADADARAAALQPRLSRLAIEVPPEVRAFPGLEVRRDGEPVGAAQFGTAIAVDPGPHVVEVSAPGKEPWKTEVKVGADAATEKVPVPALADVKPAPGGETGGSGAAWPWQKKAAIGAAGAGVIGVAIGAIFGADALAKHGELQERCTPGTPRVCDAEGLKIADAQNTAGTASTIGFAVGGALVAAGVVLWLVAPSGEGGEKLENARPTALHGVPRARRGVWIAPVAGEQAGAVIGGAW